MSAQENHTPNAPRLLGPPEIRELADRLGISPTKKLGQNFVHDPNTVRKIVAEAQVGAHDHVIEVGPGLGSLTLALLDHVETVTAVELDAKLAATLERTVADRAGEFAPRLAVRHQDALTVTREQFAAEGLPMPTALVANLPYNVSVPVLMHLLAQFPSIKTVLVMVQLEVADRLAAAPGTKIYGVPSVKAAYYGTVRRAATIGKNVFWPAPKIDSGLVRIDRFDPHNSPWAPAAEAAGVDLESLRTRTFALADAAFLQRRKTLRAALSSFFGGGAAAEEVLTAAGISPQERGEKLGVEQFVNLAATSLGKEDN
ncbi:MAG TPA: 16S rRNA (adenine(1518)-N(6)/adenine(1519)-N(6))-dimethyltransferase RsmA [Candidatus Corynebacterium gallistercoris]|uniref:Ribosomal RNA small subunit methyltransferase A n=1 Tax=Candidatus Corynebacterium gallistercoris TaxID=2838530 RepID=A0A9D1RXB2_9CORY|nr:16S rRNA (adenine(1518)-N(6)/adenine(1519)-N(6))-dimethyltransferase RsmA [Candidatus Corynebacterium gallistercoris]